MFFFVFFQVTKKHYKLPEYTKNHEKPRIVYHKTRLMGIYLTFIVARLGQDIYQGLDHKFRFLKLAQAVLQVKLGGFFAIIE